LKASDSRTFEICPSPTTITIIGNTSYLPLYEAQGYVAQGGATYCALKDKYGVYHLVLITGVPTIGEYWEYKILDDPLITMAMKKSNDLLVIYSNETMMIFWYDFEGKLVGTEKVPTKEAKEILEDIRRGLYNLQQLD